MIEFRAFPKVPRLSRDIIITEKLDGTNASIMISQAHDNGFGYEGEYDTPKSAVAQITDDNKNVWWIWAGSRNRWITPDKDNYNFAKWVSNNAAELVKLGPGHHFGEWWGNGIQRGYGLKEKKFSLFNVGIWLSEDGELLCPKVCEVVPILHTGMFNEGNIMSILGLLADKGSVAAPGYDKPEGIMIYHTGARQYFKKTFENDEAGKGQ